jgi:hypothetical protein
VLCANTSLHTLSVWGNKFGEEGARSLSNLLERNSTLIKLDLHTNRITDAGAAYFGEALKKNTNLQILYMNDTHLNAGAASVCLGLEHNTTLRTMYLGKNQVDDTAADSIGRSLRKNTTLRELSLGDNQVRLSNDWAHCNLSIVYLHGNKLLENVPHKYLYNNLPKIRAHLKNSMSAAARHAVEVAIDEGLLRNNSSTRSGEDLARAVEDLEAIVGVDDPTMRKAAPVLALLQEEEAARVECRAALLSDQIIDLDAVVERMEVGTVPCSNRVPLFSFFFRGNSFLMFLPLQLTTFFQMTSVVIPSHVLRRRC